MTRDILEIAGAINTLYQRIYSGSLEKNEMKMHKLLYFAQKKHYSNFGEWLFDDDFEGWVHGPVNKRVRNQILKLPVVELEDLTLEEEYTIREIVFDYGQFSALYLKKLSHQDNAYKKSRIGLRPNERGEEIINKSDIINDIINEQNLSEERLIMQ